jgi:hypothetical protein
MKFISSLKAAKGRILAGALVLALASYVGVQYLTPVDSSPSPSRPLPLASFDSPEKNIKNETPNASSASPGMKVYVDPKTGQFQKPPVGTLPEGAQMSKPLRDDKPEHKTFGKELEERVSPVIGGGIVTDVRLRFRRPLVASRDADGNLTIQHVPQKEDLKEGQ